MKITKEEYQAFQKHYAWALLKNPDYRFGQAFLNFFPSVYKEYGNDGDLGALEALTLYNSWDQEWCQTIIDKWLDQ